MKMMLSTPRTSSSAVSVTNASQAWGSVSNATADFAPREKRGFYKMRLNHISESEAASSVSDAASAVKSAVTSVVLRSITSFELRP